MLKSLLGLGRPRSLSTLSKHFSSTLSHHSAVVHVFPKKDKLDELEEVEGSVWVVERSACSRGMNGTLLSRSLCLCLSCGFPSSVSELEKSNGKLQFFSASSLLPVLLIFNCIVHHSQGDGAAPVRSDTSFPAGSTAGQD